MIERIVAADLGGGDNAALTDKGVFALVMHGQQLVMTEAEARRLWSNLGTMFRESAKWNG